MSSTLLIPFMFISGIQTRHWDCGLSERKWHRVFQYAHWWDANSPSYAGDLFVSLRTFFLTGSRILCLGTSDPSDLLNKSFPSFTTYTSFQVLEDSCHLLFHPQPFSDVTFFILYLVILIDDLKILLTFFWWLSCLLNLFSAETPLRGTYVWVEVLKCLFNGIFLSQWSYLTVKHFVTFDNIVIYFSLKESTSF